MKFGATTYESLGGGSIIVNPSLVVRKEGFGHRLRYAGGETDVLCFSVAFFWSLLGLREGSRRLLGLR